MTITVFHNDKFYAEFKDMNDFYGAVSSMPRDAIVFDSEDFSGFMWSDIDLKYLKDSDISPVLKHLQLVLSL